MTDRFILRSDRIRAKPCKVAGCVDNANHTASLHGFCAKHAYRFKKYGDPLAGHTAHGAPKKHLETVVLTHEGDDCLIWPYARNSAGYGNMLFKGKHQLVHRLVCAEVNGPPPTSKHYALHKCGNGHLGCVNPRHLQWGTPSENNGDAVRHGTFPVGERVTGAKLNADAVRRIRAMGGRKTAAKIAAEFGVTPSNISYILSGSTWKGVQ